MLKAMDVAFERNTIICFCTFSSDTSHEVWYSNVLLQWESLQDRWEITTVLFKECSKCLTLTLINKYRPNFYEWQQYTSGKLVWGDDCAASTREILLG